MQTSRLWESVIHSSQTGGDIYNRSFSSGRVAFSVPSNYFDALAERAIIESATMEQLCAELAKIEEYYIYQLKEGAKPSQISDKVRAAMVQKIQELKMSNSFTK